MAILSQHGQEDSEIAVMITMFMVHQDRNVPRDTDRWTVLSHLASSKRITEGLSSSTSKLFPLQYDGIWMEVAPYVWVPMKREMLQLIHS